MPPRIKIGCLCGRISLTAEAKSPALPVEVGMCHCDPCRYTTGMVGVSYVPLSSTITNLLGLVRYESPESVTRYFCDTCGSYCLINTREDDGWHACSGVVSRIEPVTTTEKPDVITINQHWHVDDTIDGGISGRLTHIGGQSIPCYGGDPAKGSEPMQHLPESPMSDMVTPAAASTGDRLRASCHCGGVEFFIMRPKK